MPAVCLTLSVHHARRLRRFSGFDAGTDYFDDAAVGAEVADAAARSYRPALDRLADAARRHDGRFRFGLAITGSAIDLLADHAPDVIDRIAGLVGDGHAAVVGRADQNAPAFLYSADEFAEQVRRHSDRMHERFGRRPRVFFPAGYAHGNALAADVRRLGFNAMFIDGADAALAGRGPNDAYRPPSGDNGDGAIALLLRHRQLSGDVAVRFADRDWPGHPLTADRFAGWALGSGGSACHLGLTLGTFGRTHDADTGILDFLAVLPAAVLDAGGEWLTPDDAADRAGDAARLGELDVPFPVSAADADLDLSAWLGNAMQANALHELYGLEHAVKDRAAAGDGAILADWRPLTAADHFYAMGTKPPARPGAPRRCHPFDSPYDAYIHFMNVLDHLRRRTEVK